MSKNSKDVKAPEIPAVEVAEVPQESRKQEVPAPVLAAFEKPKPKKGARIYVGPTMIRHGLIENTVFKGYELPKNVQALANSNPCIKALIVPVFRLTEVQAKLSDKTSLEYKNFQAAKKIN